MGHVWRDASVVVASSYCLLPVAPRVDGSVTVVIGNGAVSLSVCVGDGRARAWGMGWGDEGKQVGGKGEKCVVCVSVWKKAGKIEIFTFGWSHVAVVWIQ